MGSMGLVIFTIVTALIVAGAFAFANWYSVDDRVLPEPDVDESDFAKRCDGREWGDEDLDDTLPGA